MAWDNQIPKINSYSLTDLHDFDDCPFRFFVRHHLDRKYEIDESNEAIALGNLLDQSIKKFHSAKYYGCEVEELEGLVRAASNDMRDEVNRAALKGRPHFYSATIPFLTEEVILEATRIFQDYYIGRDKKIRPSIDEVGFCKYVFPIEGDNFQLWGGPDTLEMGDDGLVEIVDYKSRQDVEKGKRYMDMDLMPKIYTLLCSEKLLKRGYKKARFVVRYWQDPKDENFYEEFDLESMSGAEFLFRQKIERILRTFEFRPCGKSFCNACKSIKKDEFLKELEQKGFRVISGEEFLKEKFGGK